MAEALVFWVRSPRGMFRGTRERVDMMGGVVKWSAKESVWKFEFKSCNM